MTTDLRSALVVGGGIAGLTHAIALRRHGFDVEVVEQNPDWTVAGWGLSLTGPALRALTGIGLDRACIDAGYGVQRMIHCGPDSTERARVDLPALLGAGSPAQIGIGRPELLAILRDRALADGAVLRTGRTVTSVESATDAAHVVLDDGTTRTVGYVLGADGVRSATRTMIGIDHAPQFTGQMVWRAVVERPDWADALYVFAGATQNAGLIPISATQAYVFLTENTDTAGALPQDGLADGMRALLAPFTGRFADVCDTITDPATVVRRPVLVTSVDEPWHRGRVALAGDAVHSPSPQLVSGAALAVEDAVVLADEVARLPVAEAFAAYWQRRRDRGLQLVATSVEIGRLEREGRHAEIPAIQGRAHGAMAAPA